MRRRLLALPRTLRWTAVGAALSSLLWLLVVIVAAAWGTFHGAMDGDTLAALETGVQQLPYAVIMLVMVCFVGGVAGLVLGLVVRLSRPATARLAAARRSGTTPVNDA